MKKQIQTFMRYRFLLEDLISRDLKVKYRRSVLGLIWSILNPLLMMLVVTTVFSTILRIQIENFPLYYLTGSLIFNFISEATSAALISIISSAQLIKKVYVPKYIFPLEKTLFSFVNMLFSLIAIVIIMVITPNTPWHWTLVLFPVPLIYALVFAIGLGLILASVNVFFRDVPDGGGFPALGRQLDRFLLRIPCVTAPPANRNDSFPPARWCRSSWCDPVPLSSRPLFVPSPGGFGHPFYASPPALCLCNSC